MVPYCYYTKTRKVFETFKLIKSGEATVRPELADIFEVDEKTITSYIKLLERDYDVEIDFDKNLGKYKIKSEGVLGALKTNYPLSADDVNIILSALMQSKSFMETRMRIIQNALLGLLNEDEAKKLKQITYIENSDRKNDHTIVVNIELIRKAMREEKKISFRYTSGDGNIRIVKIIPYSFAHDFGKYYIIGIPDDIDKLKHYRLDRMGEVKLLQEEGKRSEKFNIEKYLKRTWYMYSGEETRVVVRFKNIAYKVVTERNMADGRLVNKDDECFTYEFICNGTQGIKLWILGFGADAEVLEPAELREDIRKTVFEMMKNYE